MKHVMPRALRGSALVRADANDPKAIFEQLNVAFEAFKAKNDEELAALKKGKADVVTSEHVDRINADVSKLQAALDEQVKAMAAMQVGPAGKVTDPAKAAYAAGFDKFFRKGIEAGLDDLAVKASMKTDSDPDGGYVVPVDMETAIDRVLSTVSAMRSISDVIQVSSNMHKRVVNLGGTTGGWVGERESRAETNTSTLAALEYPVMELYANPAATQTMLDDAAINVESWISAEVGIVFAEKEGAAFISGTGVNEPRGLLSYTTVADASYSWGSVGHVVTGSAADFIAEDPADPFIDLIYALKQGYRANARFIMNRANQAKVRKFKDDQDNYMWTPPFQGGIQGGQPATLLGYPIVDDDNMPAVAANAYPVAFGDFNSAYLIVDRIGIRVLRDPFTNKPYVHFYTTKRVGGGIKNFEAVKLLKCST